MVDLEETPDGMLMILHSRPDPQCSQIRNHGQMAWEIGMPKPVPGKLVLRKNPTDRRPILLVTRHTVVRIVLLHYLMQIMKGMPIRA